jgi:hypothetical protein
MVTSADSNACNNGCDVTAQLYDPATSTSAIMSDTPVQVTYGTGNASGVLVADRMTMAGFKADQVSRSQGKVQGTNRADEEVWTTAGARRLRQRVESHQLL